MQVNGFDYILPEMISKHKTFWWFSRELQTKLICLDDFLLILLLILNESKQINKSIPPKIIRKNTYGFFDDLIGIEVNQFTWTQLTLEVRFKEDPSVSISPHSVRMRENMDQKKSEYGHFSRSKRR